VTQCLVSQFILASSALLELLLNSVDRQQYNNAFFKKMFSQQLAFIFNSVWPAACLLFHLLFQPSIICNSDMYVAQDM
jgi:hypothetical protein